MLFSDGKKLLAFEKERILIDSPLSESKVIRLTQLENKNFHRRIMLFCESFSFLFMCLFGLFLMSRFLKSERRSRESEKKLIQTLSHEARTPLTALKLRIESILERKSVDSKLAGELNGFMDEVRRLGSVLNKSLSLYRMENRTFIPETFPLSVLIKDVSQRMDPFFRSHGAELTVSVDSNAQLRGDYYFLESSIENIFENAVLYNSNPQKKVHISMIENGNGLWIDISDNGLGIDEDDFPYIFQKFYRGSHSRRTPGTGLGLYLSRSIIEAHAGTLKMLKSGKDGTSFRIELKRA